MDSFLRLRLVPAAVLLLIALSSAQACTVHRAELSLECRLASKLEDCFPSSTHRWARKLADCFGESGDVRSDDTQHRLLEKWKHTPRPIMCMDCADGASDGEEHSLSGEHTPQPPATPHLGAPWSQYRPDAVPIAASLRFRGKHAAKEQQSADLGAAAGDVPKLASYKCGSAPATLTTGASSSSRTRHCCTVFRLRQT